MAWRGEALALAVTRPRTANLPVKSDYGSRLPPLALHMSRPTRSLSLSSPLLPLRLLILLQQPRLDSRLPRLVSILSFSPHTLTPARSPQSHPHSSIPVESPVTTTAITTTPHRLTPTLLLPHTAAFSYLRHPSHSGLLTLQQHIHLDWLAHFKSI